MRNRLASIAALAAAIAIGWYAAVAVPDRAVAAPDSATVPTLAVTASAEIPIDPDVVIINLGVETRGKTARDTQRENAAQAQAVVVALKAAGLSDTEIQTAGLTVYPEWDFSKESRVLTGYVATHQLQIKTKRIELAGALIDAASKAGANQVNGIQFSVEDETAAQAEALKLAVARAEVKARAMAQAAGLELVRIVGLRDQSAEVLAPVYGRGEALKVMSMADAGAPPIQAGQIWVRGGVQIEYEVRPR